MEKYYNRIPNNVVYNNNKETLINKIKSDKLPLVFLGLYELYNIPKGVCNFTVDGLLQTCDIPIDKRSKDEIKRILNQMYENDLFSLENINEEEFKSINKNTWITIRPKFFDKDKDSFIRYFQITDKEKNAILSSREGKGKYQLFAYYCYIKSRVYKGAKGKDPLARGKYEVTFFKYDDVRRDLGFTNSNGRKVIYDDATIQKYNKILDGELDLIKYDYPGDRIIKQGGIDYYISSAYTYVLTDTQEWQHHLKGSIKYYKEREEKKGVIFMSRKKKKDSDLKRQLTSIITKLEEKKKTKDLTDNEKRKLDEAYSKKEKLFKSKKDYYFDLLKKSDEKLISEIIINIGDDDRGYGYKNLELDLELIDEEGSLQVPWDFYCDVIMKYEEDRHQEFVDLINDKKEQCA